jgi:hypothetical protein
LGRALLRAVALVLCVLAAALPAAAQDKFVALSDAPQFHKFSVAPDGSRLYMAAEQAMVLDASGRMIDRFKAGGNQIVPLPDGWFMVTAGGPPWVGRIALVRPDGTEARRIVGKGGLPGDGTKPDLEMKVLRADMTGWTSPCGLAVDAESRLIFAIDTTMAQRDDRILPDPDWSRIAVFDFDGKFIRDINRYNALAADAKENDWRRTWYNNVALDRARKRVYVTARRPNELWCFAYDGTLLNKIKPEVGAGAVAVFKDGRVAVGNGMRVVIYDAELKKVAEAALPETELRNVAEGIRHIDTDDAGRLYAVTGDRTIAFVRWSADLKTAEAVGGPQYLRIIVDIAETSVTSGQALMIKTQVHGRPQPQKVDRWQAMIRPTDGSDLSWRPLAANWREGILGVVPPAGLRGIYDLLLLYGDGPLELGNRQNLPYVQRTIALVPQGARRSVAVITASARRAFRQAEAIPLVVVRRDGPTAAPGEKAPGAKDAPPPGARAAAVRLSLESAVGVIASADVSVAGNLNLEVPGSLTRRLAPGRYLVRPDAPDHECYALALDIAPAEPDSPLQRIIYHEMHNAATSQQQLPDLAERMAFQRDWAAAVARMGVTRETDRNMGSSAWRHDHAPVNVDAPGFAPAEYYALPGGNGWEIERYLDEAVRRGIAVDSQILGHCSGVRFRDFWLRQLDPVLQQAAQWRARFPSFYGFNYNDEMFFGQWVTDWTPSDVAWLRETAETQFKGRPMADTYRAALRRMYDSFNHSVALADPAARRTATPMWQFPACEGSYPPVIYKDMTETYSHYVSEGYHLPWYAPHSAENLRRPGLPLMGVFDSGVGESTAYAKNAMLMLGRGVQGVGVEYLCPWDVPHLPDSYEASNLMAKMYGPVFAECPPADEAAVLYSYAQDSTERRNNMGSPHWERVFALFGAGLMAGVPMGIAYEEDVAAGLLLAAGKPRTPMLLLAGQKVKLPEAVQAQISKYIAAGGKVFADADSADFPGAARLSIKTHEIGPILGQVYAGDAAWPMLQPIYEKLAADLAAAVKAHRRFPVDTDDPWVAKNQLDGGAVRYVVLATETGPFAWDAGTAWAMQNACYNGTWLPKTVRLTLPAVKGVVYDVFDKKVLRPGVAGGAARLAVDMTTYPGRLLAIAPAPLGPPRIAVAVRGDTLHYKAMAVTDGGGALAARVPLRIRLSSDRQTVLEVYRGTDVTGSFTAAAAIPVGEKQWRLEVTELLGGQGSAATVSCDPGPAAAFVPRPDVEIQRADRIGALLELAAKQGVMTLVAADDKVLSAEQTAALAEALKTRGIELKVGPAAPKDVTPGVYLAAGFVKGGGRSLGDMLRPAWTANLLPYPLTESTVPGPGRGLAAPLFAPRGYEEHCVALVGGDAEGLARTVDVLVEWLKVPQGKPPAAPAEPVNYRAAGKPAPVDPVPRLSDLVGVKLTGVVVAADGRHLLVTAEGYLKNLLLVEDAGKEAKAVRAERVGQTKQITGPYVSADGRRFGASSRVTAAFGEGFHLIDAATGARKVFASFGDMPPQRHTFAADASGDVVIAPGTFGVVCWKRDGAAWREAWAIDYWKTFDGLDWPVSDVQERIPQFQAAIPPGADYALITFCEFSSNGWVTPENFCTAYVAAVGLADGKERWHFDVPIPRTQVWPTLHASPDGRRLMLQVQMGGWNKETFRFFALDGGKAAAQWDSKTAPTAVAVAGAGGRIAQAYAGRLLEMRSAQGKLIYNLQWRDQPVSLAFAADAEGLFVADDAGRVTCLDGAGERLWQADLGCRAVLTAAGGRLYAAGADGRLRRLGTEPGKGMGAVTWLLDCTPLMADPRAMAVVAESARFSEGDLVLAVRPSNVSEKVPGGENLLAAGKARLTLGGTKGWMSAGKVEIKPELLTNGKTDDVDTPWLHPNEVFWDGGAGRQVYAEIEFPGPTDLKALTVYENPKFRDSWPTQGLVQVWDDRLKTWNTVMMGVFLRGPVNTYPLNLKGVVRIRYVPWNNYLRNFYTSEIEVR